MNAANNMSGQYEIIKHFFIKQRQAYKKHIHCTNQNTLIEVGRIQ